MTASRQKVHKVDVDLTKEIYSLVKDLPFPKPSNMDYMANLAYVVNPSAPLDINSTGIAILKTDFVSVGSEAVELIELVDILDATLMIRISVSVGDLRVAYDEAPVKGGLGEPWFKGGMISVTKDIAEIMQLIQDGSVATKLYVVQLGYVR